MSSTPPADHEERRAPELLECLRDAAAFYRNQVERSWVPDYLNRRNLYAQLVPAGLGYAPDGWDATSRHLLRVGHSADSIEAAGMARRTPRGLVDVFRDRLMVPLTDPDGALVGFTGRAAPGADPNVPKYLNSPATKVFAKRDLLYGLAEDAEALRHGAMPVIVEGPMDRLALTQAAGGRAIVGLTPCGTAFGPRQAAALLAVVGARRPIAVALDADDAGRAATRHCWEVLADAGAQHLRHIQLPAGKDPADLVRSGRPNVLRHAITQNRPLVLVVADQTIASAGVAADDWQSALLVARQLFRENLHRIPAAQVGTYVAHVAQRLRLEPELATVAATEAVSWGSGS